MQTLTQILSLVVPPTKRTVEYKIIFTADDFLLARKLCGQYGDDISGGLTGDTPLADRLQALQIMMFRLEQHKAAEKKRGNCV